MTFGALASHFPLWHSSDVGVGEWRLWLGSSRHHKQFVLKRSYLSPFGGCFVFTCSGCTALIRVLGSLSWQLSLIYAHHSLSSSQENRANVCKSRDSDLYRFHLHARVKSIKLRMVFFLWNGTLCTLQKAVVAELFVLFYLPSGCICSYLISLSFVRLPPSVALMK